MNTTKSKVIKVTGGVVNIGYVVWCFAFAPVSLMRPKSSNKSMIQSFKKDHLQPTRSSVKFYGMGENKLLTAFMSKQ